MSFAAVASSSLAAVTQTGIFVKMRGIGRYLGRAAPPRLAETRAVPSSKCPQVRSTWHSALPTWLWSWAEARVVEEAALKAIWALKFRASSKSQTITSFQSFQKVACPCSASSPTWACRKHCAWAWLLSVRQNSAWLSCYADTAQIPTYGIPELFSLSLSFSACSESPASPRV